MKRSHHWNICSETPQASGALSLFPFHKEIISRTCSGASSSDGYYSTFDERPLSPLPARFQESDPAAIDDVEPAAPAHTITTSFNLQASSNKRKPYPSNRKDRIAFTAAEMDNAEDSQDPDDWDDFLLHVRVFVLYALFIMSDVVEQLDEFYTDGCKEEGTYLKVRNEYFAQ